MDESRKRRKSLMSEHAVYDNPLVTRYASRAMAELWGAQRKFSTWRRLWVALAEAEHELGLLGDDGMPRIGETQIALLKSQVDAIDFDRAAELERRKRHDVMAHVATFAEVAPAASDIIHLGATSCYVTDNTDLLLMREGLGMVRDQLVGVIDALARFAQKWRDVATLGFTHFQPAQLTTVGKRATLWAYDFVLDLHEIEHRIENLRFRGAKGTTGTQASFLALFHGDHAKVRELDALVSKKMGFDQVYPVTGQTYTRKVDSQVLGVLSGIGQSAHKFGTDLRLLAHRQEVEEPFESEQVGSSAMAYKRNPMRAERMCGLSRFLESLTVSADQTASTQWLERTLDDSVNRRLTLPQAFLTVDGVLRLALNIANGLVVNPDIIRRQVDQMFPYMATENVLMAAVAKGGDRQALHERIRQHSVAVTTELKAGAARNDLLDRLAADGAFAKVDFNQVLQRGHFIGRAPEQVDEFIAEVVAPIRRRYPKLVGQNAEVNV
jgi:adenylosuccinate lyase